MYLFLNVRDCLKYTLQPILLLSHNLNFYLHRSIVSCQKTKAKTNPLINFDKSIVDSHTENTRNYFYIKYCTLSFNPFAPNAGSIRHP